MVDSTSGVGQVQNIQPISKSSSLRGEKRAEETRETAPKDDVQISDEALSISQAEKTAGDLSAQLEQVQDVSLGLNPNFDESV